MNKPRSRISTQSRRVETNQRLKQNICAVGDVLRSRELARRMADPANAWNKDHPNLSHPGYLLSIVTRPAGKRLRRKAQSLCRFINHRANPQIRQSRVACAGWLEIESRPCPLCNTRRFGANLSEHVINLARVQIAQLESQDDFSRNHVVSSGHCLNPSDVANLTAWHTC